MVQTKVDDWRARVVIQGREFDDAAIRDVELARAHHALSYLKDKIGDDGMRALVAEDVAERTRACASWLSASGGRWRSASVELFAPSPDAATFHAWFLDMMKERRELRIRAAHPEHFLTVPSGSGVDIIENVGQDELPWFVRLDFTDPDETFPTPWDARFPRDLRLGSILKSADGARVGSALHEMRDGPEGLHLKLTIVLPEAVPDGLLHGHLMHFSVEFRNWARTASRSAD